MDVIILAGGLGTRLRSVVNEVPKCMASVAGKPFLYYLLEYLTKCNTGIECQAHNDAYIRKVILSVGYLREVIFEWIDENGNQFPFEFDFAVEEAPLGTGGAIKLALQKTVCNKVLILNGDTFFDIDLHRFYIFSTFSNSKICIALKQMEDFNRYGTVTLDGNGIIHSFNEKQHCREGLINGGVYLIDKTKCDLTNMPEKFSFETDVLQKEVTQGNLSGYVDGGYFIDIGIPEDYAKANNEFHLLFP
jgi:D-glycero-alpha-D-manno-heptose 1-phosphate guanylyltransferase